MDGMGGYRGAEKALSMASCSPIELFSLGFLDCG